MLRCLLLLLIALGITACSNLYRPISSLESDAMAKSRRDVFCGGPGFSDSRIS